jgi:hypothetical protein
MSASIGSSVQCQCQWKRRISERRRRGKMNGRKRKLPLLQRSRSAPRFSGRPGTAARPQQKQELSPLDADDTLWHNMRHFDAAERALFAILEPFAAASVAREQCRRCARAISRSTDTSRKVSPCR